MLRAMPGIEQELSPYLHYCSWMTSHIVLNFGEKFFFADVNSVYQISMNVRTVKKADVSTIASTLLDLSIVSATKATDSKKTCLRAKVISLPYCSDCSIVIRLRVLKWRL